MRLQIQSPTRSADTDITNWIQNRANELLRAGNRDVKRAQSKAVERDFVAHTSRISARYRHGCHPLAGLKIGVDPLVVRSAVLAAIASVTG